VPGDARDDDVEHRAEDGMARTDFKSVDEYISTHPPDVQVILQRVRSAIRKALPAAQEVISYQIPAYELQGGPVLYFAGWRRHYSLYPAGAPLVAAFKRELAPFEVSKGTIRFPLSQPVPVRLIGRIARFRAKQAAARARAKLPASRRAPARSRAGSRPSLTGAPMPPGREGAAR
jgi:uncharacterized protein YdhG (YjbR/CyaY superfamily)